MYLSLIVLFSALNIFIDKITSKAIKMMILTIIIINLLVLLLKEGFYKYFNIFETFSLEINFDIITFVSVLFVPVLLTKELKQKKNIAFSFWILLVYVFPLSTSVSLFASAISLFFVWIMYFVFLSRETSLLEKLIIHMNMFITFILYKGIVLDYKDLIQSILIFTISALLVNEIKKILSKGYHHSSLVMIFVYALYNKFLVSMYGLSDLDQMIYFVLALMTLLNTNRKSEGLLIMLYSYLWILNLLPTFSFILIFMGLALMAESLEKIETRQGSITFNQFMKNTFSIFPLFLLPLLISFLELSAVSYLGIFVLFGVFLILYFKYKLIGMIFSNMNHTPSIVGPLFCYIGNVLILVSYI